MGVPDAENVVKNVIYCTYFPVANTLTLSKIGLFVQTVAPTGAKAKLGIYQAKSSTNIYPGALVYDGAEWAIDTLVGTTPHTENATGTLNPGVYWLTFWLSNSNLANKVQQLVRKFNLLGYDSTLHNSINGHIEISQTYATSFPDPAPSGGTMITVGTLPTSTGPVAIEIRAAT